MITEHINSITAIALFICAASFLGLLLLMFKIIKGTLKLIFSTLIACTILIGISFLTQMQYVFVSYATAFFIILLAVLFFRSGLYMYHRFQKGKSWMLSKHYQDALITVGLFSAVGKSLKKGDVLKQLNDKNAPLMSYEFLDQTPTGDKIDLSSTDASYMLRLPSWFGIFLKVFLVEGCEFSEHHHDCWELIRVKKGVFHFPTLLQTIRKGQFIVLSPYQTHKPKAPEDCELVSFMIKDNFFTSAVFYIIKKLTLLTQKS